MSIEAVTFMKSLSSRSNFRRRQAIVCATEGYFPITNTTAIQSVPLLLTLPVPTDIQVGETLTIYGTANGSLHGVSLTVGSVYLSGPTTTTVQANASYPNATLGTVTGGFLVRSGAAANTLTVAVAGDTMTAFSNVKYLNTFTPKAGSQVWLDTDGVDVMAVGCLAGQGGHALVTNVRLNANIAVPADGTNYTYVSWETVTQDPHNCWQSGKPLYLVAPVSGFYAVRASAAFAAATSGTRTLGVYKSGTPWSTTSGSLYGIDLVTDSNAVYRTCSVNHIPMDAGETVFFGVRSSTAVTVNGSSLYETSLSWVRLGPKG